MKLFDRNRLSMGSTHAVFTIAVGERSYLRMACALARSFRLWHEADDVAFYLATDTPAEHLPEDLWWINVIPLQIGEHGSGFSPKLHLDRLAPAQCSLFVDADCLCVGPLNDAFRVFAGHAVSVVGRTIHDGNWFGDVSAVCRRFGVSSMPRFNGGVYYLESGENCTRVFETARRLEGRYDEIGFERLRDCPNDEVLISLAMAIHGEQPIPDRGDIMNSLLAGPGGLEIDVFTGHGLLKNPNTHPQHNSWYDLDEMRPKLVHFLGTDIGTYPYRQEEIRLRLVCEKRQPIWLATAWARLIFTWPWMFRAKLKDFLRPFYHAVFGPRKITGARTFSLL